MMDIIRVIFVVFILTLISGCSSIDNQILGNWRCINCETYERNLLILEDNRIFQSGLSEIQYEYDILDKGLIELDRVNPFFLFRWLRELYCVFTTCEQVFKYKLAKDGTLHIFWRGREEKILMFMESRRKNMRFFFQVGRWMFGFFQWII